MEHPKYHTLSVFILVKHFIIPLYPKQWVMFVQILIDRNGILCQNISSTNKAVQVGDVDNTYPILKCLLKVVDEQYWCHGNLYM